MDGLGTDLNALGFIRMGTFSWGRPVATGYHYLHCLYHLASSKSDWVATATNASDVRLYEGPRLADWRAAYVHAEVCGWTEQP